VTLGLHTSDGSGTKLFTLGSDFRLRLRTFFGWWSTLTVKNMQRLVIFRLRYRGKGLGSARKWQIQVPDSNGYRLVGSSDSSKSKTWKRGIDLNIKNLAGDEGSVNIHIHQPRSDLDLYHATVNGVVVARATRFKTEPKSKFSSWQVEIAKGFDLALVCCDVG
jgi:hypothetical protein